jgi:hypothetical protein
LRTRLNNEKTLSRIQSPSLALLAVKYTKNIKQFAFVVAAAGARVVIIIGFQYHKVVSTRFPHVITTRINSRDFNCSESDRDREIKIFLHNAYIFCIPAFVERNI